ncbi:MAG: PAS domain-containing protein [Alphaproteobacteria bacterium]|nr:PAS domain-containing protein [Alphaproteobacteria bacterium]NNF23531.1 PAS domain-containing protein [Paracoccaceae bacterium]
MSEDDHKERLPVAPRRQAAMDMFHNQQTGFFPRGQSITRETVFDYLRTSSDNVKLLDTTGRVIFANKHSRDSIGSRVVNGRYWWDLWPSESHPLVIDALKRVLQGSTVDFLGFRTSQNGSPGWWQVEMAALTDEFDQIDMIFMVARDLTPRVGAQAVASRF